MQRSYCITEGKGKKVSYTVEGKYISLFRKKEKDPEGQIVTEALLKVAEKEKNVSDATIKEHQLYLQGA